MRSSSRQVSNLGLGNSENKPGRAEEARIIRRLGQNVFAFGMAIGTVESEWRSSK